MINQVGSLNQAKKAPVNTNIGLNGGFTIDNLFNNQNRGHSSKSHTGTNGIAQNNNLNGHHLNGPAEDKVC